MNDMTKLADISSMGSFHLVGINGVGMAAIARVLLDMGKRVTGSDMQPGMIADKLARRGATIITGHSAENVGDVDLVIATDAVKDTNPECVEAQRRKIPVIRRPMMLAALAEDYRCVAVTGTHGKTSTSAMIAWILDRVGLDPTVLIGADIPAYDGGGKLGSSDIMVVEACEAFNSMLLLHPFVGVITSIEPDHLDFHGSYENLLISFRRFANNTTGSCGVLIYNGDDPAANAIGRISDNAKERYGSAPDACVSIVSTTPETTGTTFTLRVMGDYEITATIPVFGAHTVSNAAGAIAAAMTLGVDAEDAATALSDYRAPRRRFDVRGYYAGITLIDDYAHHPTEIAAVLSAARQRHPDGRIIAVFQPHMYSRTKFLMADFARCFAGADEIIITEVYAAREPMKGLPSAPGEMANVARELTDAVAAQESAKYVTFIEQKGAAARHAWDRAKSGDVVVLIGAGDIGEEADALAQYAGCTA